MTPAYRAAHIEHLRAYDRAYDAARRARKPPPKARPWSIRVVVPRPPCMDDDEWAEWSRLNSVLWSGNYAKSACRDCTAAFHAEMLAAGRCDGEPILQTGGGKPLMAPPLVNWRPFKGNPRYPTEVERAAARRESSRRSHARLKRGVAA